MKQRQEAEDDNAFDLQAVFTRCYENGGYADFLDYREPPPAALLPEDQVWMESLLEARGLRNVGE